MGKRENIREKKFWTDQVRLLKVLAHPVRLRILEELVRGPRCVKDLNALIPISQPYLSQHMAALRRAKLVTSHTCAALRCYYLLRPTLVRSLIRLVKKEHPVRHRDCSSVLREWRRSTGSRKKKAPNS